MLIYVKQGQRTNNSGDSDLYHKQPELIEEISENQPLPLLRWKVNKFYQPL